MDKHFDEQTYQTGHTAPPKSKGGLLAVLLAVIIIFGGLISILGLMNVHLFRQLSGMGKEDHALAVVSGGDGQTNLQAGVEQTVQIEPSKQSLDNIPHEGGMSLQQIYKQSSASVVAVESDHTQGTGVVLTADGYVLVNCHVIANSEEITVTLSDQRTFPATVIGKDSFSDLAVVRVDAKDLTPARFGDSSVLQVGDAVVSIGNPVSSETAMTNGIISGIRADIPAGGGTLTLLQTNATLNSGDTGGPLINCYGQVVGIHTRCVPNFMSTDETQALSFALDSLTVKNIADQLIAQGFVSGRIHLGIQGHEITDFYENYYHIPQGIFITALEETSALYARGVREGDILLTLGDSRILDFDTLNNLLSALQEGEEVTVVVYRDGTEHQLTVTIGE